VKFKEENLMSLQGVKKEVLLAFISAFILYGCNAQIKLDNPKSITSKIGNNVIEVIDIGHYGLFWEPATQINFENFINFSDTAVLPSNFADTFVMDHYEDGFIDKFIIVTKISDFPTKNSISYITFQADESIFNAAVLSIKNNKLPLANFKELIKGEYKISISNPNGSSDYYTTDNYIDEDFDSESTKTYNHYREYKPIYENNLSVMKEWVENKGWSKNDWYIVRLPDRSLRLFKGLQTESSVSRSVPATPRE